MGEREIRTVTALSGLDMNDFSHVLWICVCADRVFVLFFLLLLDGGFVRGREVEKRGEE